MENNIATKNAQRLATLSSIFCIINGLEATEELARILADAVMTSLAKWYSANNREFNPLTEEIDPHALAEAFARVQEIAILAKATAQSGIDMSDLMN